MIGQVCAQFLWEFSARVLVDFTPGAGQMMKAALMLSVKVFGICHNAAHVQVLRNILRSYIMSDIKGNQPSKFAPADKDELLKAAKPARLTWYETQKKRGAEDAETPASKRAALASSAESMLAALDGSSPAKPKAGESTPKGKPTPKPAASPRPKAESSGAASTPPPSGKAATPTPGAEASSPAPAPKSAPVTAPTEDLAALLQQWGVSRITDLEPSRVGSPTLSHCVPALSHRASDHRP